MLFRSLFFPAGGVKRGGKNERPKEKGDYNKPRAGTLSRILFVRPLIFSPSLFFNFKGGDRSGKQRYFWAVKRLLANASRRAQPGAY